MEAKKTISEGKVKLTKKITLSKPQLLVVDIMKIYPGSLIMSDGWLIGGHGIQFEKRTINALKKLKIIGRDGGLNVFIGLTFKDNLGYTWRVDSNDDCGLGYLGNLVKSDIKWQNDCYDFEHCT